MFDKAAIDDILNAAVTEGAAADKILGASFAVVDKNGISIQYPLYLSRV